MVVVYSYWAFVMRNKGMGRNSRHLISYFSVTFHAGCEGVADAIAERSPQGMHKKMDDPNLISGMH